MCPDSTHGYLTVKQFLQRTEAELPVPYNFSGKMQVLWRVGRDLGESIF